MLFFKKQKAIQEIEVIEKPKSQNELVEEIHQLFNNAGDELIAEAERIIQKCDNQSIERGVRMDNLGFGGTPEAIKAKKIATDKIVAENTKKVLSELSIKYPTLKFIDKKTVERICKKYKLLFGDSSYYKGDIPEKNLLEIEQFKEKIAIAEEDKAYFWWLLGGTIESDYASYLRGLEDSKLGYLPLCGVTQLNTFKICAPAHLMDMREARLADDGYTIINKDPVVLFPIRDNIYVIVSKWGKEANDSQLQNPIEN